MDGYAIITKKTKKNERNLIENTVKRSFAFEKKNKSYFCVSE